MLILVFFAFITAMEEIPLPSLNDSLTEDVEMRDTSVEESKCTVPELTPEPLIEQSHKETDVENESSDNVVAKQDLLLAITPADECVGIKIKNEMPEAFDTEESQSEWLKQAAERAIDLKAKIESGDVTVESVKDKLDLTPNVSAETIGELITQKSMGVCFRFTL